MTLEQPGGRVNNLAEYSNSEIDGVEVGTGKYKHGGIRYYAYLLMRSRSQIYFNSKKTG